MHTSTHAEPNASTAPLPGRSRAWPEEGYRRAPYWVYTDPDIYALEQQRIFRGRAWH